MPKSLKDNFGLPSIPYDTEANTNLNDNVDRKSCHSIFLSGVSARKLRYVKLDTT